MSVFLTGYWTPFGKDEYFRKFEVYNMEWSSEINLEAQSISSAPYGGLIALVRDRRKIVQVHGGSKPVVSIFNAAGVFVSSFVWDSGQIIQMGWSSSCDLLCVREDGQVLIYDMFSNWKHKFSMGQEAQDIKVVDAKIFYTPHGTGIAVLTTANTIFIVNNVRDVKVRKLPEPPGVNNSPSAWIVVCEDRCSRVLYARDKDIFSLGEGDTLATLLSLNLRDDASSIKDMAVSSNHEMLAVLSSREKLWIGSVDGTRCSRIFDCWNMSLQQDAQLLWCGTDAVILKNGLQLHVVGLEDENISYTSEDYVFCVQEIDCVRVISSYTMEVIQKVPSDVRDIFKINSTSPSSYLLEASKQFQKKSHRANEYLHLVKPKLFQAVMQCTDAAGHEFDVTTQKLLIKAAQFGKICLDDCSPENYVTMIRILRCLNSIRNPKIGLPITVVQLKTLTMQGLMELLMIRRHYFLALDLAAFLKMPDSSRIQLHWACYKVQHSRQDPEVIARVIANKIGQAKDISYKDIAMEAFDCGKHELAVKLIEYEPRADLQIPLLLKLNENFLALNKAIDSGNTDLVYHVLSHMGKNVGKAEFQMAIRHFPLAQALYLKRCATHNVDLLKDVYTQEDNHKWLAELSLKEFLASKNSGSGDASLVAAHESYKRAKMDFNVQMCDEQLKLNKYQKGLEEKMKRGFCGLSLNDTLKTLLLMGDVKLADKLRAEYKVPDRRYWWLRIQVLGEENNVIELEKFSKFKKSPIGYEPFVDICLKMGNQKEAVKYLPKVKDELKVQYYTKVGMMEEAAQIAYERRDVDALEYLAPKCDPVLSDKIRQYVRSLRK